MALTPLVPEDDQRQYVFYVHLFHIRSSFLIHLVFIILFSDASVNQKTDVKHRGKL